MTTAYVSLQHFLDSWSIKNDSACLQSDASLTFWMLNKALHDYLIDIDEKDSVPITMILLQLHFFL